MKQDQAKQRVTLKRAMRLLGHTPNSTGLDLGGVYSVVCADCGRQGLRIKGQSEGSALAVKCDKRAKGQTGAAAAIARAIGSKDEAEGA